MVRTNPSSSECCSVYTEEQAGKYPIPQNGQDEGKTQSQGRPTGYARKPSSAPAAATSETNMLISFT
eukprot:scaffold1213_cov350-Prasinococcus_capsulatus_cf.AAC.6